MKVTAIVPSAGRGVRIKSRDTKSFLKIGGRPIIAHTLQALNKASCIDEIIVAVAKGDIARTERVAERYGIDKLKIIVQGGATRFESVSNCLGFLSSNTDYVAVHDGARPFIDEDTIRRAICVARRVGACVVGVPLIPTLKEIDKGLRIVSTPPRRRFWVAQTPQVFKKNLILKAYKSASRRKMPPTDDSVLVELLGKRVKMVEGSYRNIKITTPQDLKLARILAKRQN